MEQFSERRTECLMNMDLLTNNYSIRDVYLKSDELQIFSTLSKY